MAEAQHARGRIVHLPVMLDAATGEAMEGEAVVEEAGLAVAESAVVGDRAIRAQQLWVSSGGFHGAAMSQGKHCRIGEKRQDDRRLASLGQTGRKQAGYGNPAYFRRGVHNGIGPELRLRPTVQQRKVKQTGLRPRALACEKGCRTRK